MRILVVDDVKTFPFNKGDDVTYARTLAEGLEQIESSWGQIWLDHDLGGEDTIRPIVRRLAEMAYNGEPPTDNICICSLNPVGVDYIRSSLERWYWIAYCTDPSQVRSIIGEGRAIWY